MNFVYSFINALSSALIDVRSYSFVCSPSCANRSNLLKVIRTQATGTVTWFYPLWYFLFHPMPGLDVFSHLTLINGLTLEAHLLRYPLTAMPTATGESLSSIPWRTGYFNAMLHSTQPIRTFSWLNCYFDSFCNFFAKFLQFFRNLSTKNSWHFF